MARRRTMLHEAENKILYEGPEPGTLVQYYKDQASVQKDKPQQTADGKDEAPAAEDKPQRTVDGKGVLNNRICEHVMTNLNRIGVPTHFLRRLNMREQLVRMVEVIPLRMVVRNVAVGDFARRLGVQDGEPLQRVVTEFYYMDPKLDFPLVNEDHIYAFNWACSCEVGEMTALAMRTNDFLSGMFLGAGIRLADFQMEFGREYSNDMERLIIVDEISPDTCRLLDIATGARLDSDSMREDVDGLVDSYSEVARRLGLVRQSEARTEPGPPRLVRHNEGVKMLATPSSAP